MRERCRGTAGTARAALLPPGLLPAGLLLAGLMLGGCSYTVGGPNHGAMTVRVPGTLPAVTAPRPAAPVGPPPSGRFEGVGRLSNSAGSGCRLQIPIRNFVVTGNQVRYLGFRGTIGADGFVQMQAGGRFLYGYFDGGHFAGHYWQPHPACTYDLTLDHAG